jgi:hypothetical protein
LISKSKLSASGQTELSGNEHGARPGIGSYLALIAANIS